MEADEVHVRVAAPEAVDRHFLTPLFNPRSIVAFGLRGTILEGEPREIPEVLAGLDAVTADDVARVAKDLLAPDKLRLAAIGPLDDEARFEKLLG